MATEEEQKSDIRVWVVNGEVVAAFRRFSLHKDFRSNYSISHEGEKIKLTEDEESLAIRAADAVGLYCAGVDIMRDRTDRNRPYVIEVNGNASLKGIQTVTGINIAASIVDFAETLCKNNRTKATSEPEVKPVTSQIAKNKAHRYLGPLTMKAMSKQEKRKLWL